MINMKQPHECHWCHEKSTEGIVSEGDFCCFKCYNQGKG